jgi:signal transduction histidine kinase
MRLRVILLVVATSSLVLVSFLVPLALVLRSFAANEAVSKATTQAQSLAPLVVGTGTLSGVVDQMNMQSGGSQITVFLPGRQMAGLPAPVTATVVKAAASGQSFTAVGPAGTEVLAAVQGLPGGPAVQGAPPGTAVIRIFVPNAVLRQGVARAWLLLVGLGLGLLAVSVVVADQLARSLVRPIAALAQASDLLATGDLTARATVAGPPEVRRAGSGDLLAHERETVADLSHRLRTPLTALRIDAESLRDVDEMTQLTADVDAVERTVNEIIRAARRPSGGGVGALCDASMVINERAAFWRPLAEDQERPMMVEVAAGPVLVNVSSEDLAACTDVLLENVFSHTAEGAAFTVRLSRRAGGGAWLVIADDGPGFPDADPTERGRSSGGSTGLGLDIARRIAEASGGSLTIGRSTSGGGAVTVGLGPPPRPPDSRRHRRARPRPQGGGPGEPAEDGTPWSLLGSSRANR